MSDRDVQVRAEMLECRHFVGIHHNTCCKAGVNFRAHVGGPELGWVTRLPCVPLMSTGKAEDVVPCEQRDVWTREEAERNIDAHERAIERFFSAHKAAKADAKVKGFRKGHAGAGELPCPVCDGGTLRYTVAAYNGHMHGRCSTANCVSWME